MKLRQWLATYRLYRKGHSPMYAARLAFDITYRGFLF